MRDTAAESPVRIASRSSPEIGAGEGAAASSPATRDAKREVSATQTIHADDLKHATERHLERWERRNPAGNRPDSIAGGWILSADPHARRATFAGVFQDPRVEPPEARPRVRGLAAGLAGGYHGQRRCEP